MEMMIPQIATEMYKQIYSPAKKIDSTKPKELEIEYPESDGEPMGETEFHVIASLHLYGALRQFFRISDDIFVAADMFMYYEKGNPKACKAPDVMVVKGVPVAPPRRTFKLWEENAGPCVIFEISSRSTMIEDLITKSVLYATLGVREYFLFDPLREFWKKRLRGFHLSGKEYVEISPDRQGRLFSEELGASLVTENDLLRVIDPKTGVPVPSLGEAIDLIEQAQHETQKAKQETQKIKQQKEIADQKLARARERTQKLEALLKASGIDAE